MPLVLVAQRSRLRAERMAEALRAAGHQAVVCPVPRPPLFCPRLWGEACMLADGADLLIYDPSQHWRGPIRRQVCLAEATACASPGVPMLLSARRDPCHLAERFPQIETAPRGLRALVTRVSELLGSPQG